MKAKDRRDKELQRGKATRPPRRRVLIACEGDKLEPAYFYGLRRSLGLGQRMVILPSGNDSDPRNVVKSALAKHNQEDRSFDLIFCVVDKDTHPGLDEARKLVDEHKMGKAGTLKLIVSVPCFEVWLLLHLIEYSTAAYQSPGDAKAKMEKALPGYSQMGSGLHDRLKEKQAKAVQQAKRLEQDHAKNGSAGNPSTEMPSLLEAVETLADEARWPGK